MSASDGFGILMLFTFFAGIALGEIRWRQIKNKPIDKPVKHRKKRKEKDDTLSDLTDDSEGDGLFLDDPIFPEDFDGEDD